MKLALQMLVRDWRAGELRILGLALVIAVTSVTSVAFFADRVTRALIRDAHQLLGGDLVISSDQPFEDSIRPELLLRGLTLAESTSFVSMARHDDAAQLVSIKAVSDEYPLRGRLRVARSVDDPDYEIKRGPTPGNVWVDGRLPAALNVKVGDTLETGSAKFRIEAILTMEPDRGITFFNVAPRIMMNIADVAQTGLLQPGARATHRIYVAGERKVIDELAQSLGPRLSRGQSMQGLDNARPEIRQALARAQQFLGLTALLAVILAAVAIGLATRRYVMRHLDSFAVMRCMGATQSRLFWLSAGEFLLLGAAASAVGCIVGLGSQAIISLWLAELAGAKLPLPSLLPALQGFVLGLVLLLGFALPPLLQLRNVPAIRVIRRETGMPRQGAIAGYLIGLAAVSAMLLWQAGDLRLGAYVLGGFLGALIIFATVTYAALTFLARYARLGSLTWRYGLANLRRRAAGNTVQVLSLSLGLVAILLLTFTRGDLIEAWRAKTPVDAPNRFILNIQPEQRELVSQFFEDQRLPLPTTYPMVRARLMAINDKPIAADDMEDARSKRLVEREFNLSYLEEQPAHNKIVAGRWFTAKDFEDGALSIEEGIAKTLNVQVGDRLSWQVAGQTLIAPITSLRRLEWDSMQVNFFVIATPKVMAEHPASFITAFHLSGEQSQLMAKLSREFPNLTVVDTTAIVKQALEVMDQIIRAVQFVFMFALIAGIVVLYAALLSTEDERVQEAALMRALGASRSQVGAAQRAEFLALGLIAGILASAGAAAIGAILTTKVFQLDYRMDPWIWLAGPLLGLLCVALNAWTGTRAALNHPPLLALRER